MKQKGKVIKLSTRRGFRPSANACKVIVVIAAIVIALALAFVPNAYKVTIGGQMIGAVKDKEIINAAKETVIAQLEESYNAEVRFEEEPTVELYHAKKKDYIDQNYLVSCIRKGMNIVINFKEVYVDGESVGIIRSENELEQLKEELKHAYYGDRDVKVEFGKKVEVKDIYAKESDLTPMERLVNTCTKTTPKSITHTVQAGETLSGIADKYNTTMDSILKENGFKDGVVLQVGQTIQANTNEPLLPLNIIKD